MPDRWYELLWKLKCCGLNTVETYCCWNLHEENPGEFDFTGRLDIEKFLNTAEGLGLYVILRPGPYICAEWENGGIPAWLLKDENTRLRTDEGLYLEYIRRYFDRLIPKIIPHLQTNGGGIIMVADENEYGSFGNSSVYMNKCADMLRGYGVDVPIVTPDGQMDNFITGGHADGCLPTLWGEITPKYLAIQKEISEHLGVELPVPEPVPVQSLGEVELIQCADLFENLENIGGRHESSCIRHMEYYGQNYGYILYRSCLPKYRSVKLLAFSGLSDRVNVYFNGIWRGTVERNEKETCLTVDGWMDGGGVLDLLVENLGRSNFSMPMNRGDRKGILNHVWIRQMKSLRLPLMMSRRMTRNKD